MPGVRRFLRYVSCDIVLLYLLYLSIFFSNTFIMIDETKQIYQKFMFKDRLDSEDKENACS